MYVALVNNTRAQDRVESYRTTLLNSNETPHINLLPVPQGAERIDYTKRVVVIAVVGTLVKPELCADFASDIDAFEQEIRDAIRRIRFDSKCLCGNLQYVDTDIDLSDVSNMPMATIRIFYRLEIRVSPNEL